MKRIKSAMTLIQSVLVILMMGFVTVMIIRIDALQGTARVINYAGIIHGATQREVKLEIAERPNDQLIEYLDIQIEHEISKGDEEHEQNNYKACYCICF